MPYEYRKLSPREREGIVKYRLAHGYPFRGAGACLITATNFEHQAIMRSPERRTEHVLLLIQSLNDVSAVLKYLHGKTSREWNIEDNLTEKRRVWYKFADTYIRSDAHLHLAFNYIHFNPVKHSYVSDPLDWPWSSLHIYYEDKGQTWLQEQWNAYEPPADFGRGWGDDIKND